METNQFAIATTTGNYMSEIYTQNGLDFETMYQEQAKLFDTKKEAEEFIIAAELNTNFVYIIEL